LLNRSYYGADNTCVSTSKRVLRQQIDAHCYAIDEQAIASAIIARARVRAVAVGALSSREAGTGRSRGVKEGPWRRAPRRPLAARFN